MYGQQVNRSPRGIRSICEHIHCALILDKPLVEPPCPLKGHSPVSRHTPGRRGPSLTFERPFGAAHFVRTVHIPGLEAPRRRLPLHPCQLPVRRRRRWRTILRPRSRARGPEPSPPAARSEPPRSPGGLARAAKAGRLDPGPLRPRPCPRPRPLPSPRRPRGPQRPSRVVASEVRGPVNSSGRPRPPLPARDPGLSPEPRLGYSSPARFPPPPRTGSVRPRPVPPAGLRRGLSRSGWRWKLVGMNPGPALRGLGEGATRRPRATALRESVSRASASAGTSLCRSPGPRAGH